jgi:hypothetical protein
MARGADETDSMKDGSLTEWEEGGTAALTEGVGYRDHAACQPRDRAERATAGLPSLADGAWEASADGTRPRRLRPSVIESRIVVATIDPRISGFAT